MASSSAQNTPVQSTNVSHVANAVTSPLRERAQASACWDITGVNTNLVPATPDNSSHTRATVDGSNRVLTLSGYVMTSGRAASSRSDSKQFALTVFRYAAGIRLAESSEGYMYVPAGEYMYVIETSISTMQGDPHEAPQEFMYTGILPPHVYIAVLGCIVTEL